jgi:uncharacterized protein YdeI (YjbR/CyaY-like superfamily)
MPSKPRSFRTEADFRAWLEKHHASEKELMMRLFKVHARAKGIGYREALDAALCFGWIDGVRRSLDADSFVQRFTPRTAKSNWSSVNIARAKELIAEGRMHEAGLKAFDARDTSAKAPYSFEHGPHALDAAFERELRADRKAWTFWTSCPPYYRKLMAFYVMSAKRDETRRRRFDILSRYCAKGERVPLLTPAK